MSSLACGAINPDNGDQCQTLRGHRGSHASTRTWDSPRRMAEPENVGAAVIDADLFVWRLVDDFRWHSAASPTRVEWTKIVRPQPFQNCILTTADSEPPIGSVVRIDPNGPSIERLPTGWYTPAWVGPGMPWAQAASPTVTLLYRGDA